MAIVIPEGEETPGDRPPREVERDLFAERRARREFADPLLVRRAQVAEATVSTLEAHLASLERRLQESVEARDALSDALAARELEVRRVKQREHAEQQLRVEAEDQRGRVLRQTRTQMDEMRRELAATERQARELGGELERVRRELSEVQQAMALSDPLRDWSNGLQERLEQLERRTREASQALASERAARLRAERELERLRERDERLVRIVHELVCATGELRAEFRDELSALREELQRELAAEEEAQLRGLTGLGEQIDALRGQLPGAVLALRAQLQARDTQTLTSSSLTSSAESEAARRKAMTDALAQAVERLRARVAAVGSEDDDLDLAESETPQDVEEEEEGVPLPWPRLEVPARRPSWLTPAIRRMEQHYGGAQTGELIIALLAAQRLRVTWPVRYELRIAELGAFLVELDAERLQLSALNADSKGEKVDFSLEGRAADLAPLAGGGAPRRLSSMKIKVRGRRRAAKKLLKVLREPFALADLAQVGACPPPGLLLAVVGEGIDEQWLAGQNFTVAYRTHVQAAADGARQEIHVEVAEGGPVRVSVARESSQAPRTLASATVSIEERSLLHSLAGLQPPEGRPASVLGSLDTVELLRGWAAQAQGLSEPEL